jgi:probable rRNA maturation factor
MVDVRREVKAVSASWVRGIVERVLRLEKSERRWVSVLLTDNRRIRKIHKRFLNEDTPTDVISFWCPPGRLAQKESGYLGDLVVSAPMARAVAKRLGISFKEELARYLVHGTLHLLGYEDEAQAKKAKMIARQELILKKLFKGN